MCIVLAVCALAAARANADSKADEKTTAPDEQAEDRLEALGKPAAPAAPMPVFIPRDAGAPLTRVGGASRGIEIEKIPSIEVFAPEQPGYTLDPQPSLYFSLSDSTERRVEIRLIGQQSDPPETLLEAMLEGPFAAGVHRVDLERHGVSLKPGVLYMWYVWLDPRSEGRYGGGGIQLVEASAELQSELAAAGADRNALVLAKAGIWYDAIGVLSERIESEPASGLPRAQRAALLEQVGLSAPK